MKRKAVIFSVLGHAFEWYDYILYSAFIAIFANQFFISNSNINSTTMAFMVFAVGYLARPLGGVLFGFIGDIKGRSFGLKLAVWLMIFATTAIGLLPNVSAIGSSATILLVICRVLQGIAIGGEFGVSSTYLIENAPANKSSFYGSLIMWSLSVGVVMGNAMFLLINSLFNKTTVQQWAWRVPFLTSIGLGVILMFLKQSVIEYTYHSTTNGNSALKETMASLRRNFRNGIVAFCVALGDGISFYTFVIALPNLLSSSGRYNSSTTTAIAILTVICYGIGAVVSGYYGDKFGVHKMIKLGGSALILTCYPVLKVFAEAKSNYFYPSAALIGFSIGMYHGAVPKFLVESFQKKFRVASIAFTYNAGVTIFGSTAPMVCSMLIDKFENPYTAIYWYVSSSMLIALLAIFCRKRIYSIN